MKSLKLLVIIVLVLSCRNTEEASKQTETEPTEDSSLTLTASQFESQDFELGKLTQYNFSKYVQVTGMIDVPPQNKSLISTFMGGYISKTPLLVGDYVNKGQLLVTLQNTAYVEMQQNYLEIAERLSYLKAEYERQKTLYDEDITSEKNYLRAQSDYKSNLAHYNGLKKKLQMMNLNPADVEAGKIGSTINLYAPIDGHVTKVNISIGTYVGPNDVIMEIVDTEHIHLELSVFEKDIMAIKKGQRISFKNPEATEEIFQADVHLVGTTINPTSRTVKIHGHVDTEKSQFIVGMYVDAKIYLDEIMAQGLPASAIKKIGKDYFILAIKDISSENYVFEELKVLIGRQNEDYVEIKNTNEIENRRILVNGINTLLNKK